MKRLHVHVGVKDMKAAITYYSAMFGADPIKVKDDYAKWAPEDLGVNFAVSKSCGCGSSGSGVGHLGVEVTDDDELARIGKRLDAASAPMRVDGDVTCCYAKSKKAWSEDPAGVKWELFRTYGDAEELAPTLVGERGLEGFSDRAG